MNSSIEQAPPLIANMLPKDYHEYIVIFPLADKAERELVIICFFQTLLTQGCQLSGLLLPKDHFLNYTLWLQQ